MAMSTSAGRPQSVCCQPLICAPSSEAIVTFAPASRSLSRGTSSSDCSKPFVAMIKILASRIAVMKTSWMDMEGNPRTGVSVRLAVILEMKFHLDHPQQHHHHNEND